MAYRAEGSGLRAGGMEFNIYINENGPRKLKKYYEKTSDGKQIVRKYNYPNRLQTE